MNPEGNREIGDQIFLVIFVELFYREAMEEFRGPSEVWGARRLHMSFGFHESGPKSADEKLAGGRILCRRLAKWRLHFAG